MNEDDTRLRIAELEKLRSQIRSWRIGAALVIIGGVLFCAGLVYQSVRTLSQPGPAQNEFTEAFAKGFNEHTGPRIQGLAARTFSELTPVVQKELKKLGGRAPDVTAAFQREAEAFATEIPTRAEKILDSTFREMVTKREAKIRAMYPDLTEEQVGVMVTNLTEEGRTRAVAVIDRMFSAHEQALKNIVNNLNNIRDLEAESIKDQVPTWEMAVLLFEIVREDFKGLESDEYLGALQDEIARLRKEAAKVRELRPTPNK